MLKSPVKVWALHGFLGLPSDWEGMGFEAPEVGVAPTFADWAKAFNQRVASESEGRVNILVGYSMGGRLALHALQENPELWKKAILISTHTGLQKGHQERVKQDETWAERFENDPWYEVVGDWMAQPVFQGSRCPLRTESDFDRKILAAQLRNFSLGRQAPLTSPKATFIVGERDSAARARDPTALVIPQAGHRVLHDNPSALFDLISKAIQ